MSKDELGTSDDLVKQLIAFRDEFESGLTAIGANTDFQKKANGKFRQTLGNVILWYGQWERNRDYSSAINVSLALGKLSTATDFMQSMMPEEDVDFYIGIVATIEALCSQCWDRIGSAAGRIVPFEKG